MARDIFAILVTGVGVEQEFSICGRMVTKHRNRLSPSTIRDLMQFKRWVARHGTVAKDLAQGAILVESEMDDETESELVMRMKKST